MYFLKLPQYRWQIPQLTKDSPYFDVTLLENEYIFKSVVNLSFLTNGQ